MPNSTETKRVIRQQIEVLIAQKKIAQNNLTKAERQVTKLSARVTDINTALTKLEADLNG